jgi:hypothetical protein
MKAVWRRIGVVSLFAVAMAWVEAAVVVYLRTPMGRVIPYQADPLPLYGNFGWIELVREFATLVMLFTAGWLAGQTLRGRLGYAILAFGVWDIFYYIFLVPMSGWPQSLLDWDVLFLIPLVWWGPVLAPVLISGLLIAGGGLLAYAEATGHPAWPRRWTLALNAVGVLLALYTFMETAIAVIGGGEAAMRQALPDRFDWPLFSLAFVLMAAPVVDLARQIRLRPEPLVADRIK